jgi:hypothetical protein
MSFPDVVIQLAPWVVGGAIAITGACVWGWVHNTKMRIQNGYPLEGMWGQSLKPDFTTESMERVKLLTQENAALKAEVGAIKDRLQTVERIVTDKGFDVSHQIEALRERDVRIEDRSKAI